MLPFLLFVYVVWSLVNSETAVAHSEGAMTWFAIAAGYLLAMVPISFFWRSYLFRAYWSGEPVKPEKYLFGMISMWLALVIGGVFSLLGCLRYHSLLPDLFPALVAFVFFMIMWPSGQAMIRKVGNASDPSVYQEPR